MAWVLVAVFGAAGAVCRYGVQTLVGPRTFPFSTLLVNVVGCFLLGVVVALGEQRWSPTTVAAAGVGFLGAFTTFSTFAVDVLLLGDRQKVALAALYVAASVGLGVVAAGLGRALAR